MFQNKGAEIRLFLGFLQTSEIKMHLFRSRSWQRSCSLNEAKLVKVTHESKEYLGKWIASFCSYEQVKKEEQEIRSQLQLYCPKLKLDAHFPYLLTQVFIVGNSS